MDVYTWIMLIGAALILLGLYVKAPEKANQGLSAGLMLFLEILPRMILAFIFAGLMQVMAPQGLITNWMGHESGFRGLLIGMVLGTVTPGGPMTHFPIVASLYKSGVGVGPMVSYLTAWSLFGLQRVIMWELPFLGLSVVAVRAASSFLFPILAGWISGYLWIRFFMEQR
ncbi:MAG: permease [Candidatus Binatia bacterium]